MSALWLTLLFSPTPALVLAQEPAPANSLDEATVSVLQAKIATEGELNLIVGLTLAQSFQAEGLLSPTAVAQQRAYITQAQIGLSAELAPYNATIYHTYQAIPALALTVDKEAFTVLRQSKWVNHLQEDIAVPHTLASSTAVIGTPAVWAEGYDGTGQTVVILDTGIDGDHPSLRMIAPPAVLSLKRAFPMRSGHRYRSAPMECKPKLGQALRRQVFPPVMAGLCVIMGRM